MESAVTLWDVRRALATRACIKSIARRKGGANDDKDEVEVELFSDSCIKLFEVGDTLPFPHLVGSPMLEIVKVYECMFDNGAALCVFGNRFQWGDLVSGLNGECCVPVVITICRFASAAHCFQEYSNQ